MTRIGVFDSGLGGLSVLRQVVKDHKASYVYLGDNARVPYGNRSKKEIIEYSDQIVGFLQDFDIDFYIVACNTIAVNSLDFLKDKYKKTFVSVTEMGIEAALKEKGDVYLLATKSTVNSHLYKKEIERRSDKKVIETPAPDLVDLVEKGYRSGDVLDRALEGYLKLAKEKEIPNILLGCTHYPLIKEAIEKNLTYQANIIDPALHLSKSLDFKEDGESDLEIYMTKPNKLSQKMVNDIMGQDLEVKKAQL